MACQHKELQARLEDTKKLRLYAGSATSKNRALKKSLSKAKSWSRHWERKAKEGIEKTTCANKERDEAKEKAQVSRLATVVVATQR